MTIDNELIDTLLKDYKKPEDIIALEFDDSAFNPNHCRVGAIIST